MRNGHWLNWHDSRRCLPINLGFCNQVQARYIATYSWYSSPVSWGRSHRKLYLCLGRFCILMGSEPKLFLLAILLKGLLILRDRRDGYWRNVFILDPRRCGRLSWWDRLKWGRQCRWVYCRIDACRSIVQHSYKETFELFGDPETLDFLDQTHASWYSVLRRCLTCIN